MGLSSGSSNFLLTVSARDTRLVELADVMDPEQNKWKAFTAEHPISLPYEEDRTFAPPTAATRIAKGAIPPQVVRELDRRKRFYTQIIAASVDLYKMDIEDARAIGGAPEKYLAKIQNVIPESFQIWRNQVAAAALVYSVPGSTIPANLSPYLDVYTADGFTWFYSAHTYSSSAQTYSNVPGSDLSNNVDALTEMDLIFKAIRQPTGYPTVIRSRKIVSDPTLVPGWKVVLQSDFEVTTANNALNKAQFLIKGTELVEWEWLPNNFYVMFADTGDDYKLQHVVRQKMEVETEYLPSTGRRVWYARSRENFQAPIMGFDAIPSVAGI